MEDRERQRVKRRALMAGVVLVVLGLIGLYAYGSVGSEVSMKKGMENAAADRMALSPPVDAPRPGTLETATFALG